MIYNKRYQRWREKRWIEYKKKREAFLQRMQIKRAFNKLKSETVIAKQKSQDRLYNFLCYRFQKLHLRLPYSIERWIYE